MLKSVFCVCATGMLASFFVFSQRVSSSSVILYYRRTFVHGVFSATELVVMPTQRVVQNFSMAQNSKEQGIRFDLILESFDPE